MNHILEFSHPIETCNKGGNCNNESKEHRLKLIHPINCRNGGKCKDYLDEKHSFLFKHVTKCKYGAICCIEILKINKKEYVEHLEQFLHPYLYCEKKGHCNIRIDQHHFDFIHPEICNKAGIFSLNNRNL
jgi:hypothetical protein